MVEGLPYKKNDHTRSGNTIKFLIHYPLEEILFLTISSIILGWFEDWDDITYFGKVQLEWLRKFYPYKMAFLHMMSLIDYSTVWMSKPLIVVLSTGLMP